MNCPVSSVSLSWSRWHVHGPPGQYLSKAGVRKHNVHNVHCFRFNAFSQQSEVHPHVHFMQRHHACAWLVHGCADISSKVSSGHTPRRIPGGAPARLHHHYTRPLLVWMNHPELCGGVA